MLVADDVVRHRRRGIGEGEGEKEGRLTHVTSVGSRSVASLRSNSDSSSHDLGADSVLQVGHETTLSSVVILG